MSSAIKPIKQPIPTGFFTSSDANIDATCYRTHYGSNWVVCVDNNQLNTFN
jgi:hypothetical protein